MQDQSSKFDSSNFAETFLAHAGDDLICDFDRLAHATGLTAFDLDRLVSTMPQFERIYEDAIARFPIAITYGARPPSSARSVVLVATEWRSGNGGLSTMNRMMAQAIAALGVRSICYVPTFTQEDEQDASDSGVELIAPEAVDGMKPITWLLSPPLSIRASRCSVVIGHDHITGPIARRLASELPGAVRAHIIHTAPEEIGWLKTSEAMVGERIAARKQLQLELSSSADFVAAVGPKLTSRFETDLAAMENCPPLFEISPSFADSSSRTPPPGSPKRVLLFGRAEDYELKGLDLAALGCSMAQGRLGELGVRLELRVLGAVPHTSVQLRERLLNDAGSPQLQITVVPYSTEPNLISHEIRAASLVLMPSRAEGYGLTGFEALQKGVPVLVSEESGLGIQISGLIEPKQSRLTVIPTAVDQPENNWSQAIQSVIQDPDRAFERAGVLSELLASDSFERSIEDLLEVALRDS